MDFFKSLQLVDISSYSIFIAGVIAILRYKHINKMYYPFLICLWIGCINEILSGVLITYGHTTLANGNVYVYLESLLILWYLYNTGLFKSKATLPLLITLFTAAWILQSFVMSTITRQGTYFRVVYSFVLVILSINSVNRIIVTNRKNILHNADFLLCMCFIIYFAYKVLVQAFAIYGYRSSMSFLIAIYNLMLYINLCINLVYALAVLWMPKRLAYIYPL